MKGQKQKGNKAEREVARLLQEWWRPFEPLTVFMRTPMSGGWPGAKASPTFRARGDVTVGKAEADAPDSRFPFTVEVKRQEGWSERNLECGWRSPVWAWWRQAQDEAADDGVEPMLWFRKSPPRPGVERQWLVLVRFALLAALPGAPAPDRTWGVIRAEVGAQPALLLAETLLGSDPAIWVVKK